MSVSAFVLPVGFFIVAWLYSMVGFGGGSSYLALLVLFKVPLLSVPALALICNIIVAGGGWIHFYKAGHFRFKETLPFIVFSAPFAFIGGNMQVSVEFFSLVLSACLAVTAIRLFVPEPKPCEPMQKMSSSQRWIRAGAVGSGLGFVAGLVGIGGGIFLSPFLILTNWMKSKEAAASASFFILINSISGLFGQILKTNLNWKIALPLVAAVLVGGQIGSRMGAYQISGSALKKILGVLMMLAAIRLGMNIL